MSVAGSQTNPGLRASATEPYSRSRHWVADYWLPVVIALGVHVGIALAGSKKAVKHVAAADDGDNVVMIEMKPDLEPVEEENASDTPPPTTERMESFAPPQLVDVPSIAFDDAFVQPLQISKPQVTAPGLFSVPKGPPQQQGIASQVAKIFSLDMLDRSPEMTQRTLPLYPNALKRAGIEGEVIVSFVVSNTGEVIDAEVTSSTNQGFNNAALASVKRWRFKPGLYHGQPVATRMEQPVRFALSK
ncbi:energy transducer TonB [Nibricoccus sp. IMCC34717]|uniref:energy transducer TonB n=1 Tax=Nibricoccus sp. IMCC34717 TaxID=3034021 RepID=UPI0038503C03